jgi:hypothetical protein
VEQPQVHDTTLKLQDVISVAKPNLSDAESRELEELTEHLGIFAMDSEDCRRTDKVYHHIDT